MPATLEDRKAAAAARRKKVLARGDSRMAQVISTVAKPEEAPAATHDTPPTTTETAADTSTPSVLLPEPVITAADTSTNTSTSHLKTTTATTAPPPSSSAPLRGAAKGHTWSQYSSKTPLPPRSRTKKRPPPPLNAADRLLTSISSTASLRLFLAVLQGLLVFTVWHLAAAPAPSSWSLAWQQRALHKHWRQVQQKGWHRSTWAPLLHQCKTVGEMRLVTALKQPLWALRAAALQEYPAHMLLAVNAAIVCAAYMSLWLLHRRSSSNSSHGGSSSSNSTSQPPQMAWKVLTMVAPGLSARLVHLSAWQQLISSIVDCMFVLILTLGCCQLTLMVAF